VIDEEGSKKIYKAANSLKKQYDGQKNDGVFILMAHGNPNLIRDDRGDEVNRMYTGEEIKELLTENDNWNEAVKNGMEITLILATCENSTDPQEFFDGFEPDQPIAQKVSKVLGDLTVKGYEGGALYDKVGLDGNDHIGQIGRKGQYGVFGVSYEKGRDTGVVTYKNGIRKEKTTITDKKILYSVRSIQRIKEVPLRSSSGN
jgi:hypothetical protein